MRRAVARFLLAPAVALATAASAAACSLIYGLGGNEGPLPAEATTFEAGPEAATDAPADRPPPATNWCATQDASFCEDFDESDSATPHGFSGLCGNPTLATSPTLCASPPNCLAATNGGCVAISKRFAMPGHGRATVTLHLYLDTHSSAALNKIVDLEFVTPDASIPYTVGLTDYDVLYLFYLANDGDADHTAFSVTASAPQDYSISFTVDLDARTLNGSVNGNPAVRSLLPPIPSGAEVQSINLNVGIPSSTAASGESVHVDNVTFDLN